MGSWKKWRLSLMPRSTQAGWAPLRSLLCKLMVSFMDTKFHPYEFLTLRQVCVIGRGFWRKSLMLSSAHPRGLSTLQHQRASLVLHVTHTIRKWHPRKLALAALMAKAGLKNSFCLRSALGLCSTFIWQSSWMPCLYRSKHQVRYSHSLI